MINARVRLERPADLLTEHFSVKRLNVPKHYVSGLSENNAGPVRAQVFLYSTLHVNSVSALLWRLCGSPRVRLLILARLHTQPSFFWQFPKTRIANCPVRATDAKNQIPARLKKGKRRGMGVHDSV